MSDMKVIAVTNKKGGVMKTGLAIHIAAEAQRRKRRSVILELDKQGTSTFWSERRPRTDDGKKALPPEVMKIDASQLSQTLSVLNGLGVEIVTLDLPGEHNPGINEAIKAADLVLLPCRPQATDIAASAEPLAVIQRLRKSYAYVMTFVEGKAGRADEAKAELVAAGHPVCPQYIWRRQEHVDAVVKGQTVMETDPDGKAAGEIERLWKWIATQLEKGDERQERNETSGRPVAETRH